MIIDIQGIRAFIAVSETGSFSRAAEKLFITQPAVSKRIKSLEQALGVPLFDRIGKRVQPTEAGNALLPGYQRILYELEQGQRIISNLTETTTGRLSIATSHHIGLHRLPPVLSAYTLQYPDVELDIQFLESEQARPLILRGDIELAIVTLPAQAAENLRHITVWSDPMHCMVSRSHPLARNNSVNLKQVLAYPAILQAAGTHTRKLVDRALDGRKPERILLETSYLETIRAMVEAGLGWSMLPDSMKGKDLRIVNIRNLCIDRHLGIVLHEKRTLSSAAKSLVGMLAGHASHQSADTRR